MQLAPGSRVQVAATQYSREITIIRRRKMVFKVRSKTGWDTGDTNQKRGDSNRANKSFIEVHMMF